MFSFVDNIKSLPLAFPKVQGEQNIWIDFPLIDKVQEIYDLFF